MGASCQLIPGWSCVLANFVFSSRHSQHNIGQWTTMKSPHDKTRTDKKPFSTCLLWRLGYFCFLMSGLGMFPLPWGKLNPTSTASKFAKHATKFIHDNNISAKQQNRKRKEKWSNETCLCLPFQVDVGLQLEQFLQVLASVFPRQHFPPVAVRRVLVWQLDPGLSFWVSHCARRLEGCILVSESPAKTEQQQATDVPWTTWSADHIALVAPVSCHAQSCTQVAHCLPQPLVSQMSTQLKKNNKQMDLISHKKARVVLIRCTKKRLQRSNAVQPEKTAFVHQYPFRRGTVLRCHWGGTIFRLKLPFEAHTKFIDIFPDLFLPCGKPEVQFSYHWNLLQASLNSFVWSTAWQASQASFFWKQNAAKVRKHSTR